MANILSPLADNLRDAGFGLLKGKKLARGEAWVRKICDADRRNLAEYLADLEAE